MSSVTNRATVRSQPMIKVGDLVYVDDPGDWDDPLDIEGFGLVIKAAVVSDPVNRYEVLLDDGKIEDFHGIWLQAVPVSGFSGSTDD